MFPAGRVYTRHHARLLLGSGAHRHRQQAAGQGRGGHQRRAAGPAGAGRHMPCCAAVKGGGEEPDPAGAVRAAGSRCVRVRLCVNEVELQCS